MIESAPLQQKRSKDMAQATVSLKVTPNELQIIDEALKMYTYACRNIHRDDRAHPLNGLKLNLSIGGNDHRRLAAHADEIRRDIGLRTGK